MACARLTALLVLLLTATVASAQTNSGVRDEAGLFRPETVAQVNEKIQQIRDVFHRGILVETIKDLPEADRHRLIRANNPNKEFAGIAQRLGQERGVDGVYVLISTDPRYRLAHVMTYPEEQRNILPHPECGEVRRLFVDEQKHAGPNQALLDMVDLIERRFADNLDKERDAASPVTWMAAGLVVLGLLVFWMVVLIVQSRLAARHGQRQDAAESTEPAMPGLLGGMFGSPVNQWIHDQQILDAHRDNPPPVGPASRARPEAPPTNHLDEDAAGAARLAAPTASRSGEPSRTGDAPGAARLAAPTGETDRES